MFRINKRPSLDDMLKLGKIHTLILKKLKDFIKVGKTPLDVENYFLELAKRYNVSSACLGKKMPGTFAYPSNLCVAVNEQALHVYATDKPTFKAYDIVTVDLVLVSQGIHTDAAFTVIVKPEEKDKKDVPNDLVIQRQKLINVAYNALRAGIKQAKAGNHVGDIGYAIDKVVRQAGFSVLLDYGGHGIGYSMWEKPFVPNYGEKGLGPKLKQGMYIAIEPLVAVGEPVLTHLDDWKTKTKDNSDFVQVESTVMVGRSEPILITDIV